MIKEIRILPPLGIARLGSSETPLENYTLEAPPEVTGFRTIKAQPTLIVDGDTIIERTTPAVDATVVFRDGEQIRPLAPFFEVWARFDGEEVFIPLTKEHLSDDGLDPTTDVTWRVRVGNNKIFRRTGVSADRVLAESGDFHDFAVHELEGRSENFVGGLGGESIPLRTVQYLRPTDDFNQILLRFTPAEGKVYGPTERGSDPNVAKAVYDASPGRGTWHQHIDGDPNRPPITTPGGIYAQRRNEDGQRVDEAGDVIIPGGGQRPVNLGYLDDTCDGVVEVEITGLPPAIAHLSVGPPDFAPDSLPVRTVADELEQLFLGAQVAGSVTVREASEIIRRAMETVRLMNTVEMNGPFAFPGLLRRGFDSSRQTIWTRSTPEQTDGSMDQRRVIKHHANALEDMVDFEEVGFDVDEFIRRSEDVGDLSNEMLQRIPELMRGSDGMPLAMTKRQRAKLEKGASGLEPDPPALPADSIYALNLTAQAARYEGSPNPVASYPDSSIANCFPGLEFDFRNIWRRILKGIVIHESRFVVVSVEPGADAELDGLEGTILLSVDGREVFVPVTDSQDPPVQVGFSNLEWTNSLAHIARRPGEVVSCQFQVTDSAGNVSIRTHSLAVRNLFDQKTIDGVVQSTAALHADAVEPGELTQGLCSPWQADFRECGCYYRAASRPDYVNTDVVDGVTQGHSWLLKDRSDATPLDAPREYESHPYADTITYDDLYQAWERHLRFAIGGKDEK